jgi:transposase-like protein
MDSRVEAGKPKAVQARQTLTQLMAQFQTEDDCKAFQRDMRWPNGVICPRCENVKVYELKKRPFHWTCANPDCHDLKKPKPDKKNTGYRFSVLTGSIFENTKFPLRTWFQVAYLICQAKKGISALQIHRMIGTGDYRTAWYMVHRLRAAMENETFMKLAGEVEADETLIGGKEANKHRKNRNPQNRGPHGKAMVIGAISRKGSVVARVIEEAGFNTLQEFVEEVVDKNVSLVSTDENAGYRNLRKAGFPHDTVNHKAEEYVRGNIHTNTIESFWSLLKRGIMGSYHQVSKKYLPLYVNEFAWRYNNRRNPDIFRDLFLSV